MESAVRLSLIVSFLPMVFSLPVGVLGESCLDCHEDAELTKEVNETEIPLGVFPELFIGTPHEGMDCTDCHVGLDEDDLPHADPIPPAVLACLDCHEQLEESHAFHPGFTDLDGSSVLERNLRCNNCHTAHRILYIDDEEYSMQGMGLTESCGACHEDASMGYLHSAHAQAQEAAAESAPDCLTCHLSKALTGTAEFSSDPRKQRLAQLCMSCHVDNPEVSGKTLYGTPFVISFGQSIHGKALFEGNEEAPTCIDCHDSHIVARASAEESTVSHAHVMARCAQCHEQEAEDFLKSVHAEAIALGFLDSPSCTDCHGEHGILGHLDPDSPVAAENLAEQVCGECHGSVQLNKRYGMPQDRLETFSESYHGLATRGGSIEGANCASCHGYHDVRSSTHPLSRVHPDNLVATCGHCHEGANQRFAIGKVHVTVDRDSTDPVLFWIATIYIWTIILIVGWMVLHNALDFLHKVRLKARAHWHHHPPESIAQPHRLYLRMTINERLQHGLLVISFILLVITGFMLRFPDAWWVEGLRKLHENIFVWRSLMHRIAAVTMCMAGVWHLWYILFTGRGRELIRDLFPRMKDLADMKGVLLYNLGLRPDKPAMNRFCYIEKLEYWALLWGSMVMTLTGFLLWFENWTIGYLTLLGFDVALTVHFYEAILATLAILVWHFYFVIFNPDVYPMNLSWLTGYLSEEEMETEHPLELDRLRADEGDVAGEGPSAKKGEDREELEGSGDDHE